VPAGSVRVVILPHDAAAEPTPSAELIREVRAYLQARASVGVGGRVSVEAAAFTRIGVEAVLVPTSADSAGELSRLSKKFIADFLHPVTGGRAGTGWGFGTAVRRSDLVRALHTAADLTRHLAYIQSLRLLGDGVPADEDLAVAPDRLPSAGPIRVLVATPQEVCQ